MAFPSPEKPSFNFTTALRNERFCFFNSTNAFMISFSECRSSKPAGTFRPHDLKIFLPLLLFPK
jgi:hypothetical protein